MKTVYDKEYAICDNTIIATATATMTIARTTNDNNPLVSSPQTITTACTPASITSDSVVDLTEQITGLMLTMQADMPSQPSTNTPTASAIASPPRTYNKQPQRCIWYNSLEHHRLSCTEFAEALEQKCIRLDGR